MDLDYIVTDLVSCLNDAKLKHTRKLIPNACTCTFWSLIQNLHRSCHKVDRGSIEYDGLGWNSFLRKHNNYYRHDE